MENLKINWRKMGLMAGLSIVIATTAGCGKKADCDIDGYHAHKYVNNQQYVRYIDKEYLNYDGYTRQEDYVMLGEEDKSLYKFLNKRGLLRIDDNINLIKRAQESNQDFIEYRYAYTYLMPIPIYHSVGKTHYVTYSYIPTTHYSWTSDPNHSRLTGETRVCHYEYTSYKIEKDEKGEYVLIPGPEKEDIISTKDEYPYILQKYYKIVNLSDGCEADYENMEDDDIEHIQEEEETLGKEEVKTLTKKNS